MAFPSNPSNGDTYIRYGRTYQYDSAMSMWKVLKSGIQLTELSDIDITTITPVTGDALVWSGTKFEPDNINLLSVYQSELPLSGNVSGQMAYVTDTSRLYIYTGAGWFNVALVNTNPTITVGPDGSYAFATDGTPIVLTLEAQDPEEVPIAWSYTVTSGALGSTATVQQEGNVFTITPSTDREDAGEFSITFTASDGVNLATAASSFTLAFGTADQYYNSTSLLLKSGSTAGLNNTTFVDESINGFTLTSSGEVYQGSLSPYSPAGWSAYFDGTGDSLSAASNTAFAMYSGTFTFECFLYINALPGNVAGIFDTGSSVNSNRLSVVLYSSGKIYLDSNANLLISDAILSVGQWYHIAIVREGTGSNQTKLYVNGVLNKSSTVSTDFSNSNCKIGQTIDNLGLNGYLSNLRLVKGSAVYTSNFTPPTEPLTAIPGTSLLTCQSNRFIDNSTNNFAITKNGDATILPFSPHLPISRYDPTIHGGSVYFGAYPSYYAVPTTTDLSFSTGDFTVEAWVYKTDALNASIIDARAGTGTASPWGVFVDATNKPYFYQGTVYTSSIPIPLNTWAHVAVTRSSGTVRIFVNGVEGFSQSITTSLNRTAGAYIGTRAGAGTDAQWIGYISEIRVVKDTAVYTSNFTPPTQLLTAISGTTLLVKGNNAGIYDEMGKNNIQIVGNTTTSTTQTKYHDTSVYFDGTDDHLKTPYDDRYAFGTGDFTVEFWINHSSFNNYEMYVGDFSTSTGRSLWGVLCTSAFEGGDPKLYFVAGTSMTTYGATWTPLTNTWYHIAASRSGTSLKLFVNGTQIGSTFTCANDINNTYGSGTLYIGKPNNTGGNWLLNGYMEDLRITKGVARYTTTFTPPTAPLGFSNEE